MSTIHFLNVLEGDCNIIQHDSGRVSVIDVSNAYDEEDTPQEKIVKQSEAREERFKTHVPENKIDWRQKKDPDNPIEYLNKFRISNIWRFIITHPDMDHLDGIKDLYSEFNILHTWDTDNDKELDLNNFKSGYNPEDWKFYLNIRNKSYTDSKRLTPLSGSSLEFWKDDYLKILCPTNELLKKASETGDYNHASYALLYTPPKKDGGHWKILLAGDTHDAAWEHIIEEYKEDVTNIDILFAPHHGRDSDRDYSFLETLKPTVTLFGNAKSKHLAYDKYPKTRITNNQVGYVVIDIQSDKITFYVKNYEFAKYYKAKRGWSEPVKSRKFDAWGLFKLDA